MKQITEDYCSFEISKLLKEKGFDWPQSPFYSEQDMDEWRQENSYVVQNPDYNPDIPFDSETITMVAPHISQSLALKCLREVHNIFVEISVDEMLADKGYQWALFYNDTKMITPYAGWGNTYEQAVEAALLYVLKNLI